MLSTLIPTAHAQASNVATSVKNTAAAGTNYAVEQGGAGLQGLLSYIAANIDNWIAGFIIVVISYIIAKMATAAIKEAIIKKKGEEIQESVLILIDRMTKIAIVTVGVTIALAINGLNFTAVIGALSLGIGFALKDIIGNFISGIIMLAQDRVRIGDFIKVGDILGTIVNIDIRATILQALDGTEVVIPNQKMLEQTLISYSTNPFRRLEIIVGVDYSTDLPMVTSLIKGILDKDEDVVPKPESMVLVDEFSDSSINIKVLFWIESGKNWLKIRSNVAHRIKKTFNELGITIPFPIRTLKLDEDDRAFLKTMDSMRKGIVPEPKQVPPVESLKASAAGTENQNIPYKIFQETPQEKIAKQQGLNKAPEEKPAEKPAEAKELAGVSAAPKKFSVDDEPKAPPPTHM